MTNLMSRRSLTWALARAGNRNPKKTIESLLKFRYRDRILYVVPSEILAANQVRH